MTSPLARRLILRADLEGRGRTWVGHTLEVSEASVEVRTDEDLDVGAELSVALSFPGLLAPVRLTGVVVDRAEAAEPGEHAGLTLTVGFASEADRDRLTGLLARCDDVRNGRWPDAATPQEFRVLLVEDSNLIRDMFAFGAARYFGRKPTSLAIASAGDAEQAWALLERERFDLAIVDFFLPKMGGAELVERVRATAGLAALPVVGISVGGNTARRAFLRAGADIFLDKPVVLRDLFLTLELLALSRAGV